jgi:hypothetical protein
MREISLMRIGLVAMALYLSLLGTSCSYQETALEHPTLSVIAEALKAIALDPVIDDSLQPFSSSASVANLVVCLSTETYPVFAFEYLPGAGQGAEEFSSSLSDRSHPSTIEIKSLQGELGTESPYPVVVPSNECRSNAGISRLRISLSQIVANPPQEWVNKPGFFAMVDVESDQGLIIERFVYWIEVEKKADEQVTGVFRIARGIDDIKLEYSPVGVTG